MIYKPRSLLIYARTKTGKTTNLKMIAKWFYDKYKMKIRMVHCDGGGYRPFFDSDQLIQKGIVEVIDTTTRKLILQDLHRLGDGCWIDKNNEILRDERNQQVNNVNMGWLAKRFEEQKIGAYFIEGTGSVSQLLKTHFATQLGMEGSVGFEAGWKYREGEYSVGGLTPGHYGVLQTELHKLVVKKFCQLPVKLVVFTGKVQLGIEATEKRKRSGEKYATATGEPLYGPDGPGVALTKDIPSWFESCLYLEQYKAKAKTNDGKGTVEVDARRAWYRQHSEEIMIDGTPTQAPYLAGSSCSVEHLEELEEKFPRGFINLGYVGGGKVNVVNGIVDYLEFLERIEET